ncbi:MAG: hypothetical protein ABSG67_22100 [Thermoguttaceae bacterium]
MAELSKRERYVLSHGTDFFCSMRGFGWVGQVDHRRRYPDRVVPRNEIPSWIFAEMKTCWEILREEILSAWNWPGHRPHGWWWFDSPVERDNDISEVEQLRQLGLLTADEEKKLQLQEAVTL